MEKIVREITAKEVWKLKECLRVLAKHHNEVSVNFKGSYPSRPYEKTLQIFEQALTENRSCIAVVEENDGIAGFCKVDIVETKGKLDYLVVRKEFRRKGYGRILMDWAMETFRRFKVNHIEVKVVDGNEAIRLYEKYGFRMNAHILVNNQE